ncbi:hypothetical protein [Mucilaginibacter sp.]|uniref:carboxypeptidase-like regulatory domain-containing protein n=1 Tax=Mucilaginibacter sp. TaxID=1882438 RepID=UPI0025E84653|nr:hypothetical protein [Mucilaginibacter sp.]
MKQFYVIAALLFLSIIAFAQGLLGETVTDGSSTLPYATISDAAVKIQAATGQDCTFTLLPPEGSQRITFSMVGYPNLDIPIVIEKGENNQIGTKPVAWELLTPNITSKNGDRLSAAEIKAQEDMRFTAKILTRDWFTEIKSNCYYIATVSPIKFTDAYCFVDNLRSSTATKHKAATFDINAANFTIKKN